MHIKVLKIFYKPRKPEKLIFSIKVRYGWKGGQRSDLLKMVFDSSNCDIFFTVKAVNPGITYAMGRMIEVIEDLESGNPSSEAYLNSMIEKFSEKLNLTNDISRLHEALEEYWKVI